MNQRVMVFMGNIFNLLLLFSGSWLGMVGAIKQAYAIAPIIMLVILLVHIAFVKRRVQETSIIIIAGIVGALVEMLNIGAGIYQYTGADSQFALLPTWMVFIWFLIGSGIRHCFDWFARRWYFAALLGALLSPLLYFSASQVGAIELTSSGTNRFLIPGILWAFAFFILSISSSQLFNSGRQTA